MFDTPCELTKCPVSIESERNLSPHPPSPHLISHHHRARIHMHIALTYIISRTHAGFDHDLEGHPFNSSCQD